MNNIKTIIFDLGRVLIDWNPKLLYNKIFNADQRKSDWFIEHVCNQEWNIKQDAGRPFEEAIAEKTKEFPEYKIEIKAYFERWEEMLSGDIPETVKLLKQLYDSKQYNLLSITNWSAETFPVALKRFAFLDYFEDIAVSGTLKMIKPDPEIFEYMINKHRFDPSKTIFIDDSKKNVEAANSLNFIAIHYISPEQLKNDLKALNILN